METGRPGSPPLELDCMGILTARPGKPVTPPAVATGRGEKVGGGAGGGEEGGGLGGEPERTDGRDFGTSNARAPGRGSAMRTPCEFRLAGLATKAGSCEFVDKVRIGGVSTGGIRAIGGNTI